MAVRAFQRSSRLSLSSGYARALRGEDFEYGHQGTCRLTASFVSASISMAQDAAPKHASSEPRWHPCAANTAGAQEYKICAGD